MPVVRKTGGLNDTVFDVDDDLNRAHAAGMEPNGFSFIGADPAGLDYALNRSAPPLKGFHFQCHPSKLHMAMLATSRIEYCSCKLD